MRAFAVVGIAALWFSACIRSESVVCSTDLTCPADTKCDAAHGLCITDAQANACRDGNLPDGARCDADGVPGICDQALCVPGCGDGVLGVNERYDELEQCDDGNFVSHDGCSSACQLELPVWTELVDPNIRRISHVAAYHEAKRQLFVIGGSNAHGVLQDQWVRDDAGFWSVTAQTPMGPRRSAAMAYHRERQSLVFFGGLDASGTAHSDVWELGVNGWVEVAITGTRPSPRFGHGMVYDDIRKQLIAFGGSPSDLAFLDDTWTLDLAAGTWTQSGGVAPPARRDFAMAWDGARVILFGGLSQFFTVRGDTWTFDPGASSWSAIGAGPDAPNRRFGAAMASREPGKVVLVGGFVDGIYDSAEVWQFETTGWTRAAVTTAAAPSGRGFATLSFDRSLDQGAGALVLVGGGSSSDPTPFEQVWELRNVWTDRSSFHPVKPTNRYAAMVYDQSAREVLMFGGLGPPPYNQTWAFSERDGVPAWSLLEPGKQAVSPQCPPAPGTFERRALFAMAYDSNRELAIVFGGLNECDNFSGETFEWHRDVREWRWVDVSGPPARFGGAFAYDPVAGISVLFGGLTPTGDVGDTWEYNGTWTARPNAGGPGPSRLSAMAYDPSRQRLILVDDVAAGTWEYVAGEWREIMLPSRIAPPRRSASMAYDAKLGLVLFGGGDFNTDARYNDLWRLDSQLGWTRVAPVGEVPLPRAAPLVADPCRNELVLFGGFPRPSTGLFADTWRFRYSSLTPEEDCDNLVDDDDDQQLDTQDPDCQAACL